MMAYLTATQQLGLLLSDPDKAPMSLEQIVAEEIKEWKASEQYRLMLEAERYYRNRSSVQEKQSEVSQRSNTRIEHPILRKLVTQKANYLLSKPWTVEVGETDVDRAYSNALGEVFDSSFRRKVKSMGAAAVKLGVAWLQPYLEEGVLRFLRIPSPELIPLWEDAEHSRLDGFIRFYEQVVYVGVKKQTVTRAELWSREGVRRFVSPPDSPNALVIDRTCGSEATGWAEPHLTIGDRPYNWAEAPLAWLRYNEDELPLHYFVKDIIDDINWQTSVTADLLRDVAKFIYILRNYGGADLAEFTADLKRYLAVQVDGDGGVDKLQADLNIEAVMAFLDNHRRNLYDYAAAVDTKDPDLGSASGRAIGFRYMDLDADCAALADELREMFSRLKLFLDAYFQMTGRGDFSGQEFGVVFNADMPVNETDVIQNARTSVGMLSNRTILQQHPWVKDAEEELRRIDEEKQTAMEQFGAGLFGDAAKGDGLNGAG